MLVTCLCMRVHLISGLLFGSSVRSMMRQPIHRFLQLPGKGPESLLQDAKVRM